MSKTFKIEVDCANCANLVEEAAKRSKRPFYFFHDTENESNL